MSLNILVTFVIKFVTKNFQELPNLVPLHRAKNKQKEGWNCPFIKNMKSVPKECLNQL